MVCANGLGQEQTWQLIEPAMKVVKKGGLWGQLDERVGRLGHAGLC